MSQQRQTVYLSLSELLELRDRAEAESGSHFPILNQHGLMSALATPRQAIFGEELFPHMFDKAAILVLLLVRNHPFWDGNKRIALLALQEFLDRNGYQLSARGDEALRFMIDLADKDNHATATARSWIEHHTQHSA